MSVSTSRAARQGRRVGIAVLGAALIGSTTVIPAEAAGRKTVLSSTNFGLQACQWTANKSVKFTVRNYQQQKIYRVSAETASGSGTYVEYIPGYYGAKTQYYAQVIPDGYRNVYIKWTSTSSKRYVGRFYLKKSSLPMCPR